jgi:hypothetical protein
MPNIPNMPGCDNEVYSQSSSGSPSSQNVPHSVDIRLMRILTSVSKMSFFAYCTVMLPLDTHWSYAFPTCNIDIKIPMYPYNITDCRPLIGWSPGAEFVLRPGWAIEYIRNASRNCSVHAGMMPQRESYTLAQASFP